MSDGPSTIPAPPAPSSKFKLADYRYGREEMLAFYQEPYEPPEHLRSFPLIFVEETQKPMTLVSLSEEEQVCFC